MCRGSAVAGGRNDEGSSKFRSRNTAVVGSGCVCHGTIARRGSAPDHRSRCLGGPGEPGNQRERAWRSSGASTTSDGKAHAFLWTAGKGMTDPGVLGRIDGPGFSTAAVINKPGEVVGLSTTSSALRAFRWMRDDGMQDLAQVSDRQALSGAAQPLPQIANKALERSSHEGGNESCRKQRDSSRHKPLLRRGIN